MSETPYVVQKVEWYQFRAEDGEAFFVMVASLPNGFYTAVPCELALTRAPHGLMALAATPEDALSQLQGTLAGKARDENLPARALSPEPIMKFAIQVGGGQAQHDKTGLEAIVEEAQLAEELGFDTVFVPDHYVFESLGVLQTEVPAYELFLAMATLAQRTRRIRIGSHVVALIGTPEEMIEELRRREAVHGLSLLALNFSGTGQLREFGERVLPHVR